MSDFNQKNIILDKAQVYVGKNLGQLPAELLSYLYCGGKGVHMKELEAILADLGIGWVQAARIAEDLIKETALKYTATHFLLNEANELLDLCVKKYGYRGE